MPDVLRYSELMQQIQTKSTSLSQGLITCVETCPWVSCLWSQYLPSLITSPTGTLCVYDSGSGDLQCNVCCLWTVPAGASRAVFQIWGAGAGTGAPQCCGGAPYGQNGAYVVASIPVTPGCQYTLCAGCSHCCYASSGGIGGVPQSCKSYVTGYGLTNVCAEGACYSINRWICTIHGATGCCRFQAAGQTGAGSCTCDSGGFTCDASCASCGVIGFNKDALITWYGSTSLTNGIVCGLPAMWGQACWDTNSYGYYISAPAVGISHNNPLDTGTLGYCMQFTSGSCCGCYFWQNCKVLRCYPGLGGFPTRAMGGAVSVVGDRGRAGMVRVSWC